MILVKMQEIFGLMLVPSYKNVERKNISFAFLTTKKFCSIFLSPSTRIHCTKKIAYYLKKS